MKKIITFLFFGFLLGILASSIYSPSYTGNVVGVIDTKYLLDNTEEVMQDYNSNLENIPGFIKHIFGNELIRLNITLNNGSERILYIKTEKGKMLYINKTESDKPSLNVWTDEETIDGIASAEDQVDSFNSALKNKKIIYEAVKFKTKAKTIFAGAALKVFSWFS